METELNDQQREFCRLIVAGQLSHGKAYRQAYHRDEKTSDAACRKAASRLLQKAEVRELCEQLRKPLDRSTILSRQERMAMLSSLASSCAEGRDVRGAVASIAELNKMDAGGMSESENENQGMSLSAIIAAVMK